MLFSVILNVRRVFVCPWNSKYELLPTFSVRRLALNQSWMIVSSCSIQYRKKFWFRCMKTNVVSSAN